jgi:NADH dehydrogenase
MILVTGGTGFVGQEVVAELLRRDQRVRVLVRNPEKAARLPFAQQVELVRGDVLQPETLPPAMKGVTAVIHLVGFIIETRRISYEQGHFEATRNVLAAAKEAGVTRWVQMSAAGTRPNARSRYHQSKWQAEEFVRASGLEWTILRPSLIYGYDKRDRLLNLFRLILSPPLDVLTLYSVGLIDGGEPRVQPVFVKEVARCFAAAPDTADAVGKTFDLVGPVAMPWRDLVTTINRALGQKTVYRKFPLLILRALAALALVFLLVILSLRVAPAGDWPWALLLVAAVLVGIVLSSYARFAIRPATLVFSVPGEFLIGVSEGWNRVVVKGPHPSEVLKMSVEDNVGDPGPAEEVFGYKAEAFEEGVRRIVGR